MNGQARSCVNIFMNLLISPILMCNFGRSLRQKPVTRSLVLVMVAGIFARIALLALVSDGLPNLRKLEPSIIAANINAGKGFVYGQYGADYRVWKEPLYIRLLAWLTRWAGNSDLAVVVFQSFFGILTAIGVMFLALHILGDVNKGALAGVIAAANPFLAYYDTQFVHPLSMDTFLFTAVIGAILFAVTDRAWSYRRTIIAGVIMGLAMWQRASLLAAGVVMWIARIILRSERRRRVVIHGVLWLCVSMIVISPWLIRNYKITNRFLVTTDFAHILWLGNNPWSNGTYSDEMGRRIIIHAPAQSLRYACRVPRRLSNTTFLRMKRIVLSVKTRYVLVPLCSGESGHFSGFPQTRELNIR